LRRWLGNRWTSIAEADENTTTEGE
jgi:hypothetical protein